MQSCVCHVLGQLQYMLQLSETAKPKAFIRWVSAPLKCIPSGSIADCNLHTITITFQDIYLSEKGPVCNDDDMYMFRTLCLHMV